MRWLTILGMLLGVTVATQAATIKAHLIRASNDRPPEDQRLKELDSKLRKVFGFAYYQELGYREQSFQDKPSAELNLGRGFVLYAKPRAIQDGVQEIEVEWYSGRVAISKQSLKLPARQFVFIKGPEIGKEWIVLALALDP